MNNELVIGGAGYIGTNLFDKLDNPVIYDIKNDWHETVLNLTNLRSVIKTAKSVYHLASYAGIRECEISPLEAWAVNVQGTFNVAYLCSKYEVPFIFASSIAVEVNPNSFYGFTKAIGEHITLHHNGTVARIANVYGGKRFTELKNSVVARLMTNTFEDRGHDKEERDFIHVETVCEMLIENLDNGGIVNVETGRKITIEDLKGLSRFPDFPDNIGVF